MLSVQHVLIVLATATVMNVGSSVAQTWPTKPVVVVSPYQPGGTNDTVARFFADRLAKLLGRAFIVENRAGAAGIIGSTSVAKAAPDGYTLLSGNNATHVIQPLVSKVVSYDPIRDFTPLALWVEVPQFLGVSAELPVKNLAEFVALAKREPGKLNYGSAGSGSFGNFCGEFIRLRAGIDVTHIPFKGSAAAATDLIAGRIQFMLDPMVLPQSRSGKIRVLAVAGRERFPTLPEVPTMHEAGLTDVVLTGWFGMFGPPGLPKEIVDRLVGTFATIATDPELTKTFHTAGLLPVVGGPEVLARALARDAALYASIKKQANIQTVE
jgi:tripartite-type tricarboxylate transporter receptor subunit TctC